MLVNGEQAAKAIANPQHAAYEIGQRLLGTLQGEAFVPPEGLGIELNYDVGIGEQDQRRQQRTLAPQFHSCVHGCVLPICSSASSTSCPVLLSTGAPVAGS